MFTELQANYNGTDGLATLRRDLCTHGDREGAHVCTAVLASATSAGRSVEVITMAYALLEQAHT